MYDDPSYMIAIAECGSINKAAETMHISQPALSHRLKQLEAHLGCQLFVRGTVPLKPSAPGEVYLEYARGAVDAEKLMVREVYAVAENRKRRLRLTVSAPRCVALLPDVIERFCSDRRGCVVSTYTAGSPEAVERMLATAEADLAIMTPVHLDASLYTCETLCHERQMFVAPRGWDIPYRTDSLGRRFVTLDTVAGQPFIMPTTRQYFDQLIRKIMDDAGVHLDIVFQSCEAELAARLVRSGMGVTILPDSFVYGCDSDFDVYELEGAGGGRDLYCVWKNSREPNEDAAAFIRMTKEWVAARPELSVPR